MIEAAMAESCGRETPQRARQCRALGIALASALLALGAPPAQASLGYEPDSSKPVIALSGEGPTGVAVDQSNQRIYVAMSVGNFLQGEAGYIHQLEPNGTSTGNPPFTTGSAPVFSGVAVDPNTHGVFAAEFIVNTPVGIFGASRMVPFSSSGVMGTPFATNNSVNSAPQIAVDSSGRIFYPSTAAAAVQVYDASGVVQETITCTGCPDGAFVEPTSVALDAAGNLYVVDRHDGRVLKFTHSGGPYVYSGTEYQGGKHAVAVAVDPSSGSVLVGDYAGGSSYHVVAYEPSGAQFDDFGAGLFGEGFPPVEAQIGINATTHTVYIGQPSANSLRVFDLVTSHPPTATTEPATPVGQIEATLNAKVNANFHATSDCHFEYATHAFFEEHGFSGSTQRACPSLPNGSTATPESVVLTSLAPGTTYHYRVVSANNAGSVNGGAQEFTTVAETPPTATTESPAGVSRTTATLKGKVSPHGGTVTSCEFEYGLTQSYGKSVACPTAPGLSVTDVTESAGIGALSSNTTYHYRISLATNAGSTHGNDVAFTTVAPPPEEPDPEEPSGGGGSAPAPQPSPIVSTPAPRVTPKPLRCRKGFVKRRVRGKLRCVKKKVRKHHR